MNLFQAANGAATFLILGALVAGLAKRFDTVIGSPVDYLLAHLEIAYLGLFIVVFRIKTLLDDQRHFAEPRQDKSAFRYIGFVLAIISWIFWALAAYLLTSTLRAGELMAVSLLVSTLWIGVHAIEILVDKDRRENELLISLVREKWVLVNVGYMLCLVAYVGWLRPLIAPGTISPLLLLLGLLLFDLITSRSLRDAAKPNPPL
jgi:small-conductance mechanosensitive channel